MSLVALKSIPLIVCHLRTARHGIIKLSSITMTSTSDSISELQKRRCGVRHRNCHKIFQNLSSVKPRGHVADDGHCGSRSGIQGLD